MKIISNQKYTNLIDRIDSLTLDLQFSEEERENLEHQVDLFNKDNKLLKSDCDKLKKQVAQLKIELEDTKSFLAQEKACSMALRREREELQEQVYQKNNKIKLPKMETPKKIKYKSVAEDTPKKRGRKPKNEKI